MKKIDWIKEEIWYIDKSEVQFVCIPDYDITDRGDAIIRMRNGYTFRLASLNEDEGTRVEYLLAKNFIQRGIFNIKRKLKRDK